MLDLLLKSGTLVTPQGLQSVDIGITDERIVTLGDDVGPAKRVVDCEGKVLRGLMDPHVHFGFGDDIGDETMAEDFEKDSQDALIGGVPTIATKTVIRPGSLAPLRVIQ